MNPIRVSARPWEMPELTQVNRLPAHAGLWPQQDASHALEGRPSPWVQSLDGAWPFRLVERPEATPENFAAPAFDDGAWSSISVPSN